MSNKHQNFLCGMTRVLLGEGFPNKSSSVKICNPDYIVKNVTLQSGLSQKISIFIEQLHSVFPCLYTQELIEYDKKVLQKKNLKNEGVIGGHTKNLFIRGKYFLKKMCDIHFFNELFNYYLIPKHFEALRKFTPKCHGVFICREDEQNLTQEKLEMAFEGKLENSKYFKFIPFDE